MTTWNLLEDKKLSGENRINKLGNNWKILVLSDICTSTVCKTVVCY